MAYLRNFHKSERDLVSVHLIEAEILAKAGLLAEIGHLSSG